MIIVWTFIVEISFAGFKPSFSPLHILNILMSLELKFTYCQKDWWCANFFFLYWLRIQFLFVPNVKIFFFSLKPNISWHCLFWDYTLMYVAVFQYVILMLLYVRKFSQIGIFSVFPPSSSSILCAAINVCRAFLLGFSLLVFKICNLLSAFSLSLNLFHLHLDF